MLNPPTPFLSSRSLLPKATEVISLSPRSKSTFPRSSDETGNDQGKAEKQIGRNPEQILIILFLGLVSPRAKEGGGLLPRHPSWGDPPAVLNGIQGSGNCPDPKGSGNKVLVSVGPDTLLNQHLGGETNEIHSPASRRRFNGHSCPKSRRWGSTLSEERKKWTVV